NRVLCENRNGPMFSSWRWLGRRLRCRYVSLRTATANSAADAPQFHRSERRRRSEAGPCARRMTRRELLLSAASACFARAAPFPPPDLHSFWLFRLLHPRALNIYPV